MLNQLFQDKTNPVEKSDQFSALLNFLFSKIDIEKMSKDESIQCLSWIRNLLSSDSQTSELQAEVKESLIKMQNEILKKFSTELNEVTKLADKTNYINIKTALLFDESTTDLISRLDHGIDVCKNILFNDDLRQRLIDILNLIFERNKRTTTSFPKPNLDMTIKQHAAYLYSHIYAMPFDIGNRNKVIARDYHGILHTARAASYVPILANLYQKHGDVEALNLVDEDIKLLQIAALLHDAGREEEGVDYWDKDSGLMVYIYLTKLGVPANKAKLLAEATANKDETDHYQELIVNDHEIKWIEGTAKPKNIYQKLIHDADCLDIIRVRSKFEAEYLDFYQHIIEKNTYNNNDTALDELANIICEARSLIEDTGDSYNRVKINIKKEHESEEAYLLISKYLNDQKKYPIFSKLFANEKLLSVIELNKLSLVNKTPYNSKTGIENKNLNAALREGLVFARGVTKPSGFNENKHHTVSGDQLETLAELEIRKTSRRTGVPTNSHKEDRTSKQGNPNRSISLLGFGAGIFSCVGFLIINPKMSDIGNIYNENAGTGFGKKKYFTPDILSDEEKHNRLNALLFRLKSGGTGDDYSQVEITYHLQDYDAIYYSNDPTRGNKYISGSDDAHHPLSPMLQAIYLQNEYANMHNGIKLPLVEYSGLHNFIRVVDPLEYTDDNIADMWSEMCVDYIKNQINKDKLSIAALIETLHAPSKLDDVKIAAMYGDNRHDFHGSNIKSADKIFSSTLQEKIDISIIKNLEEEIIKYIHRCGNDHKTISNLYTDISYFQQYPNLEWAKHVILTWSDLLGVINEIPLSLRKTFLHQLGMPFLSEMAFTHDVNEISNYLSLEDRQCFEIEKKQYQETLKRYTKLISAIQEGNESQVANILQVDAASIINMGDTYGFKPLHMASIYGQLNIAKLLIKNGADINGKNDYHDTPLHWAAWSGQTELLQYFLQEHCNPNLPNIKNRTALNGAIVFGYPEIVKILAKYDSSIDLNKTTVPTINIFNRYIREGNIEQLKLLLDSSDIDEENYILAMRKLNIENENDFATFNFLINKLGKLNFDDFPLDWIHECIAKKNGCLDIFIDHGLDLKKNYNNGFDLLLMTVEYIYNTDSNDFKILSKLVKEMDMNVTLANYEKTKKLTSRLTSIYRFVTRDDQQKYLSITFEIFGQYLLEGKKENLEFYLLHLLDAKFDHLNLDKLDKSQLYDLIYYFNNIDITENNINELQIQNNIKSFIQVLSIALDKKMSHFYRPYSSPKMQLFSSSAIPDSSRGDNNVVLARNTK